MTDHPRTSAPTAATHHERPFARDPGRWEHERSRAARTGHIRDHTCTAACEPVLAHERTPWGWLAWTVPGDGSLPQTPHQIGVLTPGANRMQRLALHWLTSPTARRLVPRTAPGSLWPFAAAATLISLLAGLFALSRGVPTRVAVPAILPAPLLALLLAGHLPARLDARAREHVHITEGDGPCSYLHRLTVLHASLIQEAATSDRYELRRSAELGHTLLWNAAGLLQAQDTRAVSERLITCERLLLQLAHQVAQTIEHSGPEDATAGTDQTRHTGPRPRQCPPDVRATTAPTSRRTPGASRSEGTLHMPQTEAGPARNQSVYLLFAHEPYYPSPATQEINTTIVAAASLLHPHVCQPDGARIHDLLTQQPRPGEVVPLSTLTHELDGGAGWPAVGDWERVTNDLVQMVRTGHCDALSLGLSEIARALVCVGPASHVRAYDAAAGDFITYGTTERDAVLADIHTLLAGLVAEQDLWPGDGLLAPLTRPARTGQELK